MIYLGIDPGLDGALAAITVFGPPINSHFVDIFDTPTVSVARTGGKYKREYDIAAMQKRLVEIGGTYAVIEKVHAMPGQGVTSMFSMGYGCGLWEGLLAGLGIPYTRVAPQTWQKTMLRDEGKGKDASRLQAQRLFPARAELFARKKDDGRADAVMLAEYGRRLHR